MSYRSRLGYDALEGDELDSLIALLRKATPEQLEAVKAKLREGAEDDPPDFPGRPRPGGGAMDSAVREIRAIDAAIADVRRDFRHLAFDSATSAAGVYALGCRAMGVDLRGVHPSGWREIYRARRSAPHAVRAAGAAAAMANDSKPTRSFAEAYPDAAKIEVWP